MLHRIHCLPPAPVAQRIAQRPSNPSVAGSSPAGGAKAGDASPRSSPFPCSAGTRSADSRCSSPSKLPRGLGAHPAGPFLDGQLLARHQRSGQHSGRSTHRTERLATVQPDGIWLGCLTHVRGPWAGRRDIPVWSDGVSFVPILHRERLRVSAGSTRGAGRSCLPDLPRPVRRRALQTATGGSLRWVTAP